jgi:hypothetical protein
MKMSMLAEAAAHSLGLQVSQIAVKVDRAREMCAVYVLHCF